MIPPRPKAQKKITQPIQNRDLHQPAHTPNRQPAMTSGISHISHLLPPPKLNALALSWLEEDTPTFDFASICLPAVSRTATIYAKSHFFLAGTPFFDAVFRALECTVSWKYPEGTWVNESAGKTAIGSVCGLTTELLRGERVALNALSECARVATAARECQDVAEGHGWGGRVAGTRKTLPGLRILQKYGYVVGGIDPHRMDLSSMVMLKDNHVKAAGNVREAVECVRRGAGFSVLVDVECASEQEAVEAGLGGADVVMLDNFEAGEAGRVAKRMKEKFGGVTIEVSGVRKEEIEGYMDEAVDVISLSVNKMGKAVDISMKLD